MAKTYVTIPRYGVVEQNFIASAATGAVEGQTPVADGIETIQNGQILFIDRLNNEVTYEKVSNPYLMHSTARYFQSGDRGVNHFIFKVNNKGEMPRLLKLETQDMFHSNMVAFDTTEFADEATFDAAFADGKRLYGYLDGTDGYIIATATRKPAETVEFVLELSTMPDDTKGYAVRVNKA